VIHILAKFTSHNGELHIMAVTDALGPSMESSLSKCTHSWITKCRRREFLCVLAKHKEKVHSQIRIISPALACLSPPHFSVARFFHPSDTLASHEHLIKYLPRLQLVRVWLQLRSYHHPQGLPHLPVSDSCKIC
jgi:hypothetical protein